jgi:cytochrome c556
VNKLTLTSAAIATLLAMGGGTLAYAASPAIVSAIKARQANFKEIGGAFKTVNDEIKSGAPNFASVRPAAREVALRAAGQAKYFVRGSGPESGEKTRALPTIWTDPAGFGQANANFVRAAAALDVAAQKGDVAALTAARTALGGACKACHDKFRARED